MQTFRPQGVPKDFDFRLVRILEELQAAVQDHNTGFSLIAKGLTPDQEQKPLPSDPQITDHGKLDGLVPIVTLSGFVQDYNDDHTHYALLAGRVGGQILRGSRLADPRLVASANKAFTFAQNKVAGSSWASIVVRQDAPAGQLVVLALSSDDIAATGNTNTHTSITDTKGNTWTKHAEYTRQFSAGFGACISIWSSVLSFAMIAGTDTLTANFSGSATAKSMEGFQFLVPSGAVVSLVSSITDGANSGSNAPSLVLSGLTSDTYLFVRGDAHESDTIEAWTNDGGYTPFDQNDTEKSQSATTGGAQRTNSATRAEFAIKTATGTSTQPIFNISDFQIIASALVALKVSLAGSGSLKLQSIDNSNAGMVWLQDEYIHMRGDGSPTNRLVTFENAAGTELSYIRSTDGAFIGPIAPTPKFALLNTTLFNDVVAGAPAKGDLIVGNATPAWQKLAIGTQNALLMNDGAGNLAWVENGDVFVDFMKAKLFVQVDGGSGSMAELDPNLLTLTAQAPSTASVILTNSALGSAVFRVTTSVADIGTTSAVDFTLRTSATNRLTISSAGLITLMPRMNAHLRFDDNFIAGFGTGDDATILYNGTDLVIDTGVVGVGQFKILNTIHASGAYSARQNILNIGHNALQGGTTNTTAATVALGTALVTDAGLSASQFGMAQGLDVTVTNTNTTKAGLPKSSVAPYVLSLAYNNELSVIAVDSAALKITSTYTGSAASILQTNLLAVVTGLSTSVAALTGVQGCQFKATNTTSGAGDARGFLGYGDLSNASATGNGTGVYGFGSNSGNSANALSVAFFATTVGPGDSRQHYDIIGNKHAIHGALYLTTATLNLKTSNPATHLTPPTGSNIPTADLFVGAHAEIDDTLWLDKVGDALVMAAGGNIVLQTTTGTKLGTGTTQLLGFWNATPIAQPTTAVAAATFVANTSGIVNDSATFDGYTIGQVVKALRNEGLLA